MKAPGEILFLAHRIPYPPNKGEKIRAWHFLRHLSRIAPVHVGAPIDDPADIEHRHAIEAIAESACLPAVDTRLRKLRAMTGFLTGDPLTLPYFANRTLRRWAGEVRRTRPISLEFVYSSGAVGYCASRPPLGAARLIDFVDLDSDKWRQYAATTGPLGRLVYGREARTLASEEVRMARAADGVVFVSPQEADLFRAAAPDLDARIHSVANGVDTEFFSPEPGYERPWAWDEATLVFTGAMDYWANVDAVTWFARDILPRVRAQVLDARFVVVGANPTPQVRALARDPAVMVTDRVPDVRPYLAHATICVAPMRIARGIQNKVLEAMAMGRPVITTSPGVEGIDATPDVEIAVEDSAEDMACKLVSMLKDPMARDVLGRNGRARALRAFGWPTRLAELEAIIAQAHAHASARAGGAVVAPAGGRMS